MWQRITPIFFLSYTHANVRSNVLSVGYTYTCKCSRCHHDLTEYHHAHFWPHARDKVRRDSVRTLYLRGVKSYEYVFPLVHDNEKIWHEISICVRAIYRWYLSDPPNMLF